MEHLLELFPNRKTGSFWKMGKRDLDALLHDPKIKSFTFTSETLNWWRKDKQR